MAKKPTYEELEQRVKELEDEVIDFKRMVKELHESRDYLDKLFNYANAPIIVWNPKGRVTRFNRAFEHMTGLTGDEIVGHEVRTLFPEASRDESLSKIADTLSGEHWESVEIPILCKDGDVRIALWNSAHIYAEDGTTVIATIAQGQDITEFKQAEKALRESEEKYRILIETITGLVFTIAPNRNFTYLNPEFEKLTGFPAQDFIGRPFTEILASEYVASTVDRFKQSLSGKKIPIYEVELKHKDGKTVPVELKVTPLLNDDGNIIGNIGLASDITERKRAEEDLKQSENKLQLLFNTMIDYCYIVSKDYKIEFMNKTLKDKLGDQTGKICYEAFFGMESPCPWSKLENVIAGETVKWEHYLPELEGFFEIIDTPLTNQDGTVSKFGLWREITDRKQSEDALRESEEKYHLLFNKSNDSVLVYQLTKDHMPINFIDVNDVACKKLGYTREELLKLTPLDIISPKDYDLLPSIIRKLRKGKSSLFESIHTTKDGREIPVNINPNMFEFHGELTVLCVARDISELKQAEKGKQQLEAQLQQAQRMEALGTLGGGVAHDFNNLLMGIQGRTSLMMMDKDSSHPDFEHLQGIEEYVTSAADLTKQLLGFARGGKYEVKPTDINEMIKKSSSMFGRTKKEIKIHRKYQKDVWTVEADQGQIEQVLMNLYVNAWQAMPGGGRCLCSNRKRHP